MTKQMKFSGKWRRWIGDFSSKQQLVGEKKSTFIFEICGNFYDLEYITSNDGNGIQKKDLLGVVSSIITFIEDKNYLPFLQSNKNQMHSI